MSKETRLNIRITPEFQQELKAIAAYHGLSLSSYVHSTLVQKLRRERETTPEAFAGGVKYIGTVDEFDPGEALDRLGDPHVIMNDWFRFEGRSMPQDFGVVFFQGWDSFTREERVDALRDAKNVLDRTLRKSRPAEIRPFPVPKDAPIKKDVQKSIDDVELQALEPARKRKAK